MEYIHPFKNNFKQIESIEEYKTRVNNINSIFRQTHNIIFPNVNFDHRDKIVEGILKNLDYKKCHQIKSHEFLKTDIVSLTDVYHKIFNIPEIIKVHNKIKAVNNYLTDLIQDNPTIMDELQLVRPHYTMLKKKVSEFSLLSISSDFNLPTTLRKFKTIKKIINNQHDIHDNLFIFDPVLVCTALLHVDVHSFNFQTLFYLERYLKRLIQNNMTDFIMNYMINITTTTPAELFPTILRGNPYYINYLLTTINNLNEYIKGNIKNKIKEMGDHFIFNRSFLKRAFKGKNPETMIRFAKFELQNIHFDLIFKGGNVAKFYMQKYNKIGETYILDDDLYEPYIKDLSDFDFDVHIKGVNNFRNHYSKEEHDKLCDGFYMALNELKKEIIDRIIRDFFINHHEVPEMITNIIKCSVSLFNSMCESFKLNIINAHTIIRLSEEDKTEVSSNVCKMIHVADIAKFNKEINNIRSDSIISFVSMKHIGTVNTIEKRYSRDIFPNVFDLSRCNIRFSIDVGNKRRIFSKAEVFDFGYSYDNSFGILINLQSSTNNHIVLKINEREYRIKCKDINYILCELLNISIMSSDMKTSKRLIRLFTILNNVFTDVTDPKSIFAEEFHYLKFIDSRNNYNFIDGMMILYRLKYESIEKISSKMKGNSIYNVFKKMHNERNINVDVVHSLVSSSGITYSSFATKRALNNLEL